MADEIATTAADPEVVQAAPGFYICAVFETIVILGRISHINAKRAGHLVENLEGPDGEELVQWQTGSRAELLATFSELLGDWSFNRADDAYALNPLHQVQFERLDLE